MSGVFGDAFDGVERGSLGFGVFPKAIELTQRERKQGAALRTFGCYRDNNETDWAQTHVLWSVLVLSTRAEVPTVHGVYMANKRFRAAPVRRLGSWDVSYLNDGDCTWYAAEYELTMPAVVRGALLFAGRARCLLTKEKALDDLCGYELSIRGASWTADYDSWLSDQDTRLSALPVPSDGPLMSIVMPVYRTPAAYLRAALASVVAQTYVRWELVVVNASPDDVYVRAVLDDYVDDPRIQEVAQEENLGIVGNTNAGIAHCTGEYISFFDHDDVLNCHALAAMVRAIDSAEQKPGLLYCDEDHVDDTAHYSRPLCKPSANTSLLLSCNYVLHWLTVRRDVLMRVGLSPAEVEGAQDYDLTLKVLGAREPLVHIPHVLYHWRVHAGSVAAGQSVKPYTDASALIALKSFCAARGWDASLSVADTDFTYNIDYHWGAGDGQQLSSSLQAPTLGVAVLGEPSEELLALMRAYGKDCGVACTWKVLPRECAGRAMLDALARMRTDVVAVVDGAIRLDMKVLRNLLGTFMRDDVFSVAPRIVRDDGLLDNAGMVVAPDGSLIRMSHLLPESDTGYVVRTRRDYDAAALRGLCTFMRRDRLRELDLDEDFASADFAVADLCLQAYAKTYVNVCRASLTARLGRPLSLCNDASLLCEADQQALLSRYPWLGAYDPSHNPNFDPWSEYYKLGEPVGTQR